LSYLSDFHEVSRVTVIDLEGCQSSEQNSAAIEEVSASREEVFAQVEQVWTSTAALTKMAQGLQRIVAQFLLVKTA